LTFLENESLYAKRIKKKYFSNWFELFFTSNVELKVDLAISAKTNVEFVTSQMGTSSCDNGLKSLRLGITIYLIRPPRA
jgi:hypothetical protein